MPENKSWIAIIVVVVVVMLGGLILYGMSQNSTEFKESIQNIRSARRFSLATLAASRRAKWSTRNIKQQCRMRCTSIVTGYGLKGYTRKVQLEKCIALCMEEKQSVIDNIYDVLGNVNIIQNE